MKIENLGSVQGTVLYVFLCGKVALFEVYQAFWIYEFTNIAGMCGKITALSPESPEMAYLCSK